MRAITSKLNMYVNRVNVINNNIEKLVLNIIFYSFGALVLLYVLFLGNMVHNVIERRSLEASARVLSNEVRDLELTYLSLSSNVDLALSHSMGFKETKTVFATRKPLGMSLDQNGSFGRKITQNDL